MSLYALEDPREPFRCRYVGKTTQKLEKRLADHIKESKYKKFKKATWINKILNEGVEPTIILSETVEAQNTQQVNDRETYWISYFRSLNQADKNHLDGGDGFDSKQSKRVQEQRAIKQGKQTVQQKKDYLLNLPNGSERPARGGWQSYVCKTSGCYDYNFDIQLRLKHPNWFVSNDQIHQKRKAELLEMMTGSAQPARSQVLGNSLQKYVDQSHPLFDEDFVNKLQQKHPMWYKSRQQRTSNIKTQLLLDLAANVKPLPNYSNYLGYVRKKSPTYDPEFESRVRTEYPQMFGISSRKRKGNI